MGTRSATDKINDLLERYTLASASSLSQPTSQDSEAGSDKQVRVGFGVRVSR
jgi:hypothetical protein